MRTFAILDSDIIRSTIWTEDDCTRIVWITMLALKDADGFVRGCITTVAGIARQPVDKCTASLEKLEAPDPDSASPEHEGRRLLKVPGGWIVVNHHKYRDKERDKNRKEYLKEYMREYMKKKRELDNKSLTESNAGITSVSVSECECASSKEGDCKGGTKRFKPPTPEEATAYAKTIDFDLDGENFCDFYESKGWRVGNTPMKNWKAAVKTWKHRDNGQNKPTDSQAILDYAEEARGRLREHLPMGRFYAKICDALGQKALNRVKQLALEKGGRSG